MMAKAAMKIAVIQILGLRSLILCMVFPFLLTCRWFCRSLWSSVDIHPRLVVF